ncbi:MAG TPA: ATP-dependent zinc metalloprotease FtsH [Chloroflexota bacterium]
MGDERERHDQPYGNGRPLLFVLLGVALATLAMTVFGRLFADLGAPPPPSIVGLVLTAGGMGVLIGAGIVLATSRRRVPPGEWGESPPAAGRVLTSSTIRAITADWPSTRFSDVAGVDEAKAELQEVVEFLKDPARFAAVGARVPRGVLLVGPPGTGKTLLARAVAGEAGVAFLSMGGSEFVELYVGVGASRVRTLFQEARRLAPSIVFIDEIDAVGRRRSNSLNLTHEEREQTLNQILIAMDGFDQRTNVIVLAATNRPDILDPALLRPGRFDRQVHLDRPDAEGRLAILRVHTRNKPLAPDVDLSVVARQTAGLTGADLANLVNEAAIVAARHRREVITNEDVAEGLDRLLAGPRRNRVLGEEERRLTAYHEVGHALVGFALQGAERVHRISIVARGTAGGYTRFLHEDRHLWSRSQFRATLACMLGGRAAEELVFGDVTTGASDDLQKATQLARRMVGEFGMSETLGPVAFMHGDVVHDGLEARGYGEDVARIIDAEVARLVNEALDLAKNVLSERRAALEATAHALMEQETLEGERLEALLGTPPRRPIAPASNAASTPFRPAPPSGRAVIARALAWLRGRRTPFSESDTPGATKHLKRPALGA